MWTPWNDRVAALEKRIEDQGKLIAAQGKYIKEHVDVKLEELRVEVMKPAKKQEIKMNLRDSDWLTRRRQLESQFAQESTNAD